MVHPRIYWPHVERKGQARHHSHKRTKLKIPIPGSSWNLTLLQSTPPPPGSTQASLLPRKLSNQSMRTPSHCQCWMRICVQSALLAALFSKEHYCHAYSVTTNLWGHPSHHQHWLRMCVQSALLAALFLKYQFLQAWITSIFTQLPLSRLQTFPSPPWSSHRPTFQVHQLPD